MKRQTPSFGIACSFWAIALIAGCVLVTIIVGGCGSPEESISPGICQLQPTLNKFVECFFGFKEFNFYFYDASGVDPATLPQSSTFTPPYFPFLKRETDCSLTRFVVDSKFNVALTTPNYQDSIHQSERIPTTADKFPNGCQDPTTGIASQVAEVVGKTASGNTALGILSTDGVQVWVVSSAGAIISRTDYATVPSGSTTADSPFGFAVADLNGDGILDMVVPTVTETGPPNTPNTVSTLSIYLGKGDGTFPTTPNTTLSLSGFTEGVTIDDVNGDGKLDLVAIGLTVGTTGVQIFLGNGDGTFQTTPIAGPAGANGYVAVTADFNGDGKKDIATSSGQILLGNGDGTFNLMPGTLPVLIQNGFPMMNFGIAAADFNKDGKIDLAMANGTAATTDLYYGNGDGTFTYGGSYPAINGEQSIEASDLDGDGNVDLFAGSASGGVYGADIFTLSLFHSILNQGDGTFGKSRAYFSASPSGLIPFFSYDLADFNGDKKLDIVGTTMSGAGPVVLEVLTGNGDGTFQQGPLTTITSTVGVDLPVGPIVAADVNGDGNYDTVIALGEFVATNYIEVALGKGDGTFPTQTAYPVPGEVVAMAIADFNGDTKPDIAFIANPGNTSPATGTGLYLMLNNGDGTFKNPQLIDAQPYMSSLAVQDVNLDGIQDIVVVASGNGQNNVAGKMFLYLGKGGGAFQPAAQLNSGSTYPASVAIADINGDGKPDILVTGTNSAQNTGSGNFAVLLGNGDGTFQAASVTPTPQLFAAGIAVGDILHNGKQDAILGGNQPYVMLGNGDGTFANAGTVMLSNNIQNPKLIDLNGDSFPELIFQNAFQGPVNVLLNGGPPSTTPTTTALSASATSITAGQSVTFAATVTSQSGTGTPTGSIMFLDGSTSLGTATLNGSAQASLSTSSLSVGMDSITASYSGDATFGSSTSTVLTETVTSVGPATTTTTLTSMPNPSSVGQSVTFTATVTSTTAGTPSGTVTFLDGATSLGTGMLNGSAQATFSTSALSAGMHSITASYGGDVNFAASASTALTQTVNGTPDFSVTANPSAASVNAGQSTTYTLTLTPNNGFNQTVTLTCSGSPADSACTPASSTATLNGTSASMVQFNVTTSPRATALLTEPSQPLGPLSAWPTRTLLLLAMMVAAILYGRQGRPRRLALGLTIAVVALAIAACGSNHHGSAGTPAGTYTLTLTGTSGMLTHSSQVTLTVK